MYLLPDGKGGEHPVYINAASYIGICRAVLRIKNATEKSIQMGETEMESMATVMVAGAALAKHNQTVTADDRIRIALTIRKFLDLAVAERWKDDIDPVLSACYHMLKDKRKNRAEVRTFALDLLGPTIVGDADAWRKRVDRWAQGRKLDPPALPGRPKKFQNR